jgi:hypothetical protein
VGMPINLRFSNVKKILKYNFGKLNFIKVILFLSVTFLGDTIFW